MLHLLREIALIGAGALVGLTAMAALTLISRLDEDAAGTDTAWGEEWRHVHD